MKPRLVVYYSRSGKTRMIAKKLADLLDADIEEIQESKNRRGVRGWLSGGKDTLLGKDAELRNSPKIEQRELVVLGMPVWCSSPPAAVRTYLKNADFSGAKIAAFCTHDGGGGKGCFRKINELLPSYPIDTLELKKPKSGDAALDEKLNAWVEEVRMQIS